MTTDPFREALATALLEAATELTSEDFRRLATRVRRAIGARTYPPDVAPADIVALETMVVRAGRCPVPLCDGRTTVAAPRGWPRGVPVVPEVANPYRLCRGHRRLLDLGYLRVVGPPDSPSFTDGQGRPIGRRGT
jgi:hypothetical protein